MDEDLGLQDLVQTCMVHKIEVGLEACGFAKPSTKKSLAKCKSKVIFG